MKKLKYITYTANHAMAQICTQKCKDYLTDDKECITICPEMLALVDSIYDTSTQKGRMRVSKPLFRDDCWECPECEWLNPYPNVVLTSMPPKTPYRCNNCEYLHYDVHESVIDQFAVRYPTGKPKDDATVTKTEKSPPPCFGEPNELCSSTHEETDEDCEWLDDCLTKFKYDTINEGKKHE